MALNIGSRLGHYDVTALIGEGGMGQVYQATDTKLKRQVALKILPEAFAADPDRLARFQREAQVLARLALVATLLASFVACAPTPSEQNGDAAVQQSSTRASLDLASLDAGTLQGMLASGNLTASALTDAYLQRIADLDDAGPTLNAVIEVNPDARQIAADLDVYFQTNGVKGSLHGLPVILKANIDTGDQMATSAGSVALADHVAEQDAFLVAQLREAGAVILAKANLSEWANFRSTKSSSGWSSLGGQVRNPYVLDRNPCGSSSGSAVVVAASLAPLAVGTETNGSIVCPAGVNGIVGIKPTVGTVSRQGIIPVAHSYDTAGPMAKTVLDAAMLLEAIVGYDKNDPGARRFSEDVVSLLPDTSHGLLTGQRIGVLRTYFGAGEHPRLEAVLESSTAVLRDLGAQIVDDIEIDRDDSIRVSYRVMLWEFKADLNAYLKSHGVANDRDTLDDLIGYNEQNRDTVMPIFGQEHFRAAEAMSGLDDPEYLEALSASGERLREALSAAFADHDLDAMIAPTNAPAWNTDWVSGDRLSVSSSSAAAISGYPSVVVPAGYVSGLPIGVSFIGLGFSEASLIQIAYVFEQATRARVEPTYIPTLEQ